MLLQNQGVSTILAGRISSVPGLIGWAFILYKSEECHDRGRYFRKRAEDCAFAARESVDPNVRDACMKDAAHFRALAKQIERRSEAGAGGRSRAGN
jgi:hypothetical protein